jgi:RNA polymerase sigma factor (sigma-70 family)
MQDVSDLKAWFEGRVVENHRLFFSIAYQNVRDAAEAEDVVQEACLRAWRELGTLREPSSLVGWIATTIRRLAYDLRGRRRPVATPEDAFDEVAGREGEGPAVHTTSGNNCSRAWQACRRTRASSLRCDFWRDLMSGRLRSG